MRQKALTKVWVLTTDIDECGSFGQSFIGWWASKPSRKQIAEMTGQDENSEVVTHILKGGGQMDNEYQWWFLDEVKEGLSEYTKLSY